MAKAQKRGGRIDKFSMRVRRNEFSKNLELKVDITEEKLLEKIRLASDPRRGKRIAPDAIFRGQHAWVQPKFSNNMNMSEFFRIAEAKNPQKLVTFSDVLPELRNKKLAEPNTGGDGTIQWIVDELMYNRPRERATVPPRQEQGHNRAAAARHADEGDGEGRGGLILGGGLALLVTVLFVAFR